MHIRTEALTMKQREIIKELGYQYRGKNHWLYFLSCEHGYDSYNLDRDEAARMTEYMGNLEMASTCYKEPDTRIDFENGNMFSFVYSADRKTWHYGEEPLPFTSYNFGNLLRRERQRKSECPMLL